MAKQENERGRLKLEIRGISPLVLMSDRMVNKFDPLTQAHEALTRKNAREKTLDDLREISRLEFYAGIYHAEGIGPYIPSWNLTACLRDGGKKMRKGKAVEVAVVVTPDEIPILYRGPRGLDELWADETFRFTTSVVQIKARVMKTRPIFRDWALEAQILLAPGMGIDDAMMEKIAGMAGAMCGLGTYRPRYGRFDVSVSPVGGKK